MVKFKDLSIRTGRTLDFKKLELTTRGSESATGGEDSLRIYPGACLDASSPNSMLCGRSRITERDSDLGILSVQGTLLAR